MNNYNYFYSCEGQQKGPVTISELKRANITKDTLVWRDGFEDWQKAGDVDELAELFSQTNNSVISNPVRYNDSVNEETEAQQAATVIDNTTMFRNAFLFKGRARPLEFFIAFVIYNICIRCDFLLDDSLSVLGPIIIIVATWFFLSEAVRRSHDLGHNGFWIFIPFYQLWLLFASSKPGINKYGNNPKGNNKLY